MKTQLFLMMVLCAVGTVFAEIGIEVSFYQEELYYLGSNVALELRIVNSGTDTETLVIADDMRNSLDVQIRDTRGRLISAPIALIRARNRQKIQYRNLTLLPNEQLVRILSLQDFGEFDEIGIYSIQAMFFPNLYGEANEFMRSNILQIAIRPGSTPEEQANQEVLAAKQTVLMQEDLRPDEIITYTIRARQNSEWNKFFTYLDVESLLLQNPSWEMQYARSSEEGKQKLLAEFKKTLQEQRIEENITAVPSDFMILSTAYGPLDGEVLTEQVFRQSSFESIKQYRYYFKREGYWKIIGYDILNIGTRAISDAN